MAANSRTPTNLTRLCLMSSGGDQRAPRGASAARPTSTDLSARYGGTRPRTAPKDFTGKAIALVIAAIVLAVLFYGVQYFLQQEKVNAEISYVTHEIRDDHSLRVWADVTRNSPDEAAYCIVQAYDYSKAEVGRREIPIPANDEESMRIAVDIPTNDRAVAGGVYGCSSQIPAYLDVDHPEYAE